MPLFPPLTQVVEESSLGMQERIPKPLPLEEIMEKYPVKYEESMNTVLVQEVRRLYTWTYTLMFIRDSIHMYIHVHVHAESSIRIW